MRTIFTIGIVIFFTSNVFAQPVIDPNPVSESVDASVFETIAHSWVTNPTEFDRNLTWTRTVISITEGWSTAVCDLNICHFESVSSASFLLPAGEMGTLDVHLYPAGIDGAAVIQVVVHDPTETSFADTAFYYFNQALSAPERLTENIKTYPNPVVDMLNIEAGHQVHRIEIFNIEGKRMMGDMVNGNSTINLSGLPSGTFILRMFDASNQQISGNLLVKQ